MNEVENAVFLYIKGDRLALHGASTRYMRLRLCVCQVSFIDGGGEGGLASTANDAMFRCKTLLHTTGSGPATRGSGGGGGGGGWPNGEFQCEVRLSLRLFAGCLHGVMAPSTPTNVTCHSRPCETVHGGSAVS